MYNRAENYVAMFFFNSSFCVKRDRKEKEKGEGKRGGKKGERKVTSNQIFSCVGKSAALRPENTCCTKCYSPWEACRWQLLLAHMRACCAAWKMLGSRAWKTWIQNSRLFSAMSFLFMNLTFHYVLDWKYKLISSTSWTYLLPICVVNTTVFS